MLEINWNKNTGWDTPIIHPVHNFSIHPFNSTLHYGI